ncbi:MAG TPA: Glu/Leu/Phe/Val dehydrogenase [Bacteroidetes bacterium]|nr:Glu/Leu/Phe/Val dehydrogenase [Bacteroidota bacterium]
MLQKLAEFENQAPEIVFEWHDSETEAVGWVVINSLRGGAAGGGTRMRPNLNKHEVLSLAKTMEIKFSVCGPQIGGAKSGINFDPDDPRKEGVLKRWYAAVLPLLKSYYGTGGDLNVDEIKEVLPITRELGLLHCQEGVATGHFQPNAVEKHEMIRRLQDGVSKKLDSPIYNPGGKEPLVVADMITGWGVVEAVRHYYNIWQNGWEGKRVIVQGFGNVGGAAAYYIAQYGLKVVGIIDRDGGLLKPEGFSLEEIRELFLTREGNALAAPNMIPFEELNQQIWSVEAEVFLPCARSRIINKEQLDEMAATGMEVVSCGANVPFADSEIFLGPTAIHADRKMAVLPDFIANCGMARAFAYFMGGDGPLEDEAIFRDVSDTIEQALRDLHAINPQPHSLWQAGLNIALDKLSPSKN